MSTVIKINTDKSGNTAQDVRIRMDAINTADVVDGFLVLNMSDYFRPRVIDACLGCVTAGILGMPNGSNDFGNKKRRLLLDEVFGRLIRIWKNTATR